MPVGFWDRLHDAITSTADTEPASTASGAGDSSGSGTDSGGGGGGGAGGGAGADDGGGGGGDAQAPAVASAATPPVVHFVELTCDRKEMLSRVSAASRHESKKLTDEEMYKELLSGGAIYPFDVAAEAGAMLALGKQLSFDTTATPATDTAEAIRKALALA